MGLGPAFYPRSCPLEDMIKRYQQVGVAMNEMNRSMGLLDLVPEIIVPPVVAKLQYIHDLVEQGRAENGALHPELVAPAAPAAVASAPVESSPPPVNSAPPQVSPAPPAATTVQPPAPQTQTQSQSPPQAPVLK
jgi:hypothetical protein